MIVIDSEVKDELKTFVDTKEEDMTQSERDVMREDRMVAQRVFSTKQCESPEECTRYISYILHFVDPIVSLRRNDIERPYSTILMYVSPQFSHNVPFVEKRNPLEDMDVAVEVGRIRDHDVVVFMLPIDQQNVDPVFVVGTVTDLGDSVSISCSVIGYFVSHLVALEATNTFGRVISNTETDVDFDVHLVQTDTSTMYHTISVPSINPPFASAEDYDLGNVFVKDDTFGSIFILLSAMVQGPSRPVTTKMAQSVVHLMRENKPEGDDSEFRSWAADTVKTDNTDASEYISRPPTVSETIVQ